MKREISIKSERKCFFQERECFCQKESLDFFLSFCVKGGSRGIFTFYFLIFLLLENNKREKIR